MTNSRVASPNMPIPIEVDSPSGKVTVCPQRTNDMLGRFFRSLPRNHRRRTGNNSMRRTLQTMQADTPLIKNLDNPNYLGLLLDGKERLEELFAELGMNSCTRGAESRPDADRILPGFRKLIRIKALPGQVALAVTVDLPAAQSN